MSAVALWLIAAILALGVLTIGLLVFLGTIRVPLVVKGDIRLRDVALSRQPWPDREKQVSNAVDNQFQLPLLFCVGAFVALAFGPVLLEAILAWLFLAARVVHAAIFITDNNVVRRFWAYVAGLTILGIFWLDLMVRLVGIAISGA